MLLFLVLLVPFMLYILWLERGRGYVQSQLDNSLIPTAETLLQHPAPLPMFVDAIIPSPGSAIASPQNVCVSLLPGGLTPDGDSSNDSLRNAVGSLEIFVNDSRLPRDIINVSMLGILTMTDDGRLTGRVDSCFELRLEQGHHLFELRVSSSPFGIFGLDVFQSYRWAYFLDM